MLRRSGWAKWRATLSSEARHLLTIHPSDRRWQMPFAAALASGVRLLVGAWFDQEVGRWLRRPVPARFALR